MRALCDRLLRFAAPAVLALLAGACATIPPNAGNNPVDPLERYNRHMTEFNDRVDRAVVKPVAQAYTDYVPMPVRDCVGNIFSNIGDVPNALNNLLQGKPREAVSDLCRVVVNTTVGLLGCFDVASRAGLEKSDEDFGQTLGRWGIGQGPYFVWPFLGPSTIRDSVGRIVGFYTDPVDYVESTRWRNSLWAARFVDTRARLLPAERLLENALDRYQFLRDAYLQRRRNQVYDGTPPRTPDDEDDAEPPTAPGPDQPNATPKR